MISYLTNSIVGLHTVSVSMRNMKHTMNITATSLTGHVLFQFRFPNIRRPPFIEISHTFHTAEWNADFWRAASGHVHVNPERPENCTFILGYKISIYSNVPPQTLLVPHRTAHTPSFPFTRIFNSAVKLDIRHTNCIKSVSVLSWMGHMTVSCG